MKKKGKSSLRTVQEALGARLQVLRVSFPAAHALVVGLGVLVLIGVALGAVWILLSVGGPAGLWISEHWGDPNPAYPAAVVVLTLKIGMGGLWCLVWSKVGRGAARCRARAEYQARWKKTIEPMYMEVAGGMVAPEDTFKAVGEAKAKEVALVNQLRGREGSESAGGREIVRADLKAIVSLVAASALVALFVLSVFVETMSGGVVENSHWLGLMTALVLTGLGAYLLGRRQGVKEAKSRAIGKWWTEGSSEALLRVFGSTALPDMQAPTEPSAQP
ncbi:MAG: hypothetical protein IH851_00880 [Armatimonadetes bacterium]|nr:hypothetical protein [Armatimonadota bacterium]